jgi:succinate-semialdehyde dehydrogenase/glutarate-semialdehyde dehydrogenase
MSSEAQAQEVLAQVEESVRQGAKLLLGGDRPELPGTFVNPTMLIDIKPGMPAYDQEIFGPVASIFVVKDEDEAVAIANDTDYGFLAFDRDITV